MQGDFSRDTFDKTNHFVRVLMQQGRVQLDADWNEQAAILLHYLQTLAVDLIGQHGGPDKGFTIKVAPDANPLDFTIAKGRYYVDGILCENDTDTAYTTQPDYPLDEHARLKNGHRYLVYLDVWERHITYIENGGNISMREVALSGPDTTTRAKVVWQVKVQQWEKAEAPTCDDVKEFVVKLSKLNQPRLHARAKQEQPQSNPCVIQPDARYRGAENQLYRVEIHTGGTARDTATFKWSRENASVIFPISSLQGNVATLASLGRDGHLSLTAGDWVEIVDDDVTLRGKPGRLLQVDVIEPTDMKVTLKATGGPLLPSYLSDSDKHPLLRRWDHQGTKNDAPKLNGLPFNFGGDNAVKIVESNDEDTASWFMLEDGVQIQFPKPLNNRPHQYRTSDYWLIPARTATGDVEWPTEKGTDGKIISSAMPPHGVEHHYAPLAVIVVNEHGTVSAQSPPCRLSFQPLNERG